MNKIKALLKAFLGNKALWHFADDFGTYLFAGIPAVMAAFYVPTDGNWKVVVGGVVAAFIGVAYPALRRAWAENKSAVVPAVAADVQSAVPELDILTLLARIHELEDLAETVKTKYPNQYTQLTTQISLLLAKYIAKLPVA